MIVDRKWVERNIGFGSPLEASASFHLRFHAGAESARDADLQREIIDFDSEGPEGREFLAFTTATGLSRFTDIPWPSNTPVTD
jgi:hypothetical protein